jgi:transposase-like protein
MVACCTRSFRTGPPRCAWWAFCLLPKAMNPSCPHCSKISIPSGARSKVRRSGTFRRKSDCRTIQRFFCDCCKRSFSRSRFHPAYRQKKRQFNDRLRTLLCSGVSLRRSAKILHLSRTTVARKLIYLGKISRDELLAKNLEHPKSSVVEFDDQETFEHTKCKPLSITIAVESKSRRILGFEVSQFQAKGHLTRIALKKYGPRKDTRALGRRKLFESLKPLVRETATFKSDQNPHYPADLQKYFPHAHHLAFKGERGSITGQGELKKVRFDPLFSLNHTCAMTRANMNRLFRRTWCTTKVPARLADHLAIYAVFHNKMLRGPAHERSVVGQF